MGKKYQKQQKWKQNYQKIAVVLFFAVLFTTDFFGLLFSKKNNISSPLKNISVFASQKKEESVFELTKKEQAYLEGLTEKTLTIGIAEESFWSVWNKTSYGTAVPTIEILKNVFGLNVEVVTGGWSALKKELFSENIDFVFGMSTVETKEKTTSSNTKLYYSEPIFENPCLFVVPQKSQTAAQQIEGLQIGVVEASPVPETIADYLKQKNEFINYRNTAELLDAVEKNELDAAIITESMLYTLYGRTKLKAERCFGQFENSGGLCTAKEEFEGLIKLYNRCFLEKIKDTKEQQWQFLNQYILWKEKGILKELENRKNTLRFAWSGLDSMPLWYSQSGEKTGVLPEFFQFAEQCAGIFFQEVKGISGVDAKEELLAGDLDFLAGVAGDAAEKDETLLAAGMHTTKLIAAIKENGENPVEKDAEKECYWGAVPETACMLAGTIFDKSTVEYNSEKELLNALFCGEIGGIILRQDAVEYLKFAESRQDILILSNLSIPVQESFLIRAEDAQLGALLERLYHAYCIFTETQKEVYSGTENFLKGYIKTNQELTEISQKTVIWRIAAAVFFAFCVFTTILWRREAQLAGKSQKYSKLKKQKKASEKQYRGEMSSSLKETEWLEESLARTKEDARETLSGLHRLEKRIVEQLAEAAEKQEKDALTGLLTESGSWERIREILEQSSGTMAVFAYLDLENFKNVNETYGYDAGDEMLVSFSESLKTLEFDSNTIVFRQEGDRFGAFRGNLATELDYRIFLGELQSLSAQVRAGGSLVCVTYRCGAAVFHGKETDCGNTGLPRQIAERARDAMAHCRKNNLHFFQNNY